MVSGQNICRILLRFLVWKVDSLLRLFSVIIQHSETYSRVERTGSSTVLAWSWCCNGMTSILLFSILKAFLALLRRFLMSLPAPPSCLTVLPRKVNFLVVGRSSLFTLTSEGFETLCPLCGQQRYPTPACSGPVSERSPGVMEGLEFPFYSSTSGVLELPWYPLLLW